MLDSITERDRGYNYQEVIGDLAQMADLVLVLFDPHKAGTVRDLNIEARACIHFQNQRSPVAVYDHVNAQVAEADLEQAREFAEAIHAKFPGKMLAYNCSPSFNWKANLDDASIARFQRELGAMGYKFQFVTLAGFHALNLGMFNLARSYRQQGMLAYSQFQQEEFDQEKKGGYSAITHQRFVGAGYFDRLMDTITGGESSVGAMSGSTEEEQF